MTLAGTLGSAARRGRDRAAERVELRALDVRLYRGGSAQCRSRSTVLRLIASCRAIAAFGRPSRCMSR